ncbi:MAG: redoxin domain-containing protein [Caldilineaceae bacterium]
MPARSVGIILIPLIAIGLSAGLLLTVRSSAQAPAQLPVRTAVQSAAQPTAVQPKVVALAAPGAPASLPTVPAAAESTPQRLAGYVALVDNSLILRSEFDLVQSIDQAMSSLLEIDPAKPDQLLQQMVNHRLVMREAVRAGVEASDAQGRLADLLAANGKTQADLDGILRTYAVDPQQFEAYLAELVLVDQFAHQAAADKGTTVDGYVAQLQAAARIHLGDPLTATAALTAPVTAVSPSVAAGTSAAAPAPAAAPDEKRGILAGQLAPRFELQTLAPKARTMTYDDLLGKPTVLSFWTTWCPYCLRQTPVLVAGAGRYAGKDVQFVGIDVSENADAVAAYAEQHAIRYPVLLDTGGQAASAYGVDGYPTTYFLDADGRVVAHQIGAMSDEQLATFVEKLLSLK